MDLFFNELSVRPLFNSKHTMNIKMTEFAKTAKSAREKNIKHIKSDNHTNDIKLFDDYSMHDWLFDREFRTENRDYQELLLSMITIPYIDIGMENEYLSQNFCFEDISNDIPKQSCIGLAATNLYNSLAISFQNGSAWEKNILTITIDDKTNYVPNVYSPSCFLITEINEYIENNRDTRLIKSVICPCEKIAHFSDHHGKDKLKQFWKKLINSPYVISAKSTRFGGTKFIRKIGKSGLIEIVLVKTDRQYALQVETTGRNFQETYQIAKILEEKYG